ncbi:peptidylprolyl isomerase [Terrabacter sp. LjRoot27]|uniref:peptidylprolyl isomerase n=1 Tax=Terrabacter sp. LjRoot27 TaxID=3342306 RepID=UPI003ECE1DBE
MPESPSQRRRAARLLLGVAVLVLCLVIVLPVVAEHVFVEGNRPGRLPTPTPVAAPTCSPPPLPPTTYPTFTSAPDASVAQGASWSAVVRTTCGNLTMRLDGTRAPRSVASFVTLAEAGYWTDSVCHRLTSRQAPTKLLQCGDPTGRSTADPGYDLPLENVPAGRTYRVGDVGMARGDGFPGTAGEFFVVHEDFTVPAGAPVYSLIGRVTSGQEVVQQVASRGGEDTRPDGPPFQSVSVLSVDVARR